MKRRISAYCLTLFLLTAAGNLGAQSLYFPPTGGPWTHLSPDTLGWCGDSLSALRQYLDEKNSKAFLVLKDGKMVLEWYFDAFTQDSAWYWASAGKTLTATMVGLAQQEGLLHSDSATSTYLGPGWTSCDSAEEAAITVRNQLTMTTGLDEFTYGFTCTEDSCLHCEVPPDTRWFYYNAPYTLLTDVVEAATGLSINAFFRTRLGRTIGMGGGYFPVGFNRIFVSKPRDMARFGLLMLAKGEWNGTPVLEDSAYYRAMTTPSQALNPSYGYLWWLNGQSSHMLPGTRLSFPGPIIPNAPSDLIAGLGANDQKLYLVPSQNLVVIRLGNAAGPLEPSLSGFDNELWRRISELSNCAGTTNLDQPATTEPMVYPNPAQTQFEVSPELSMTHLRLYNAQGQLVLQQSRTRVKVSNLPHGIYWLAVETHGGAVYWQIIQVNRP